MRPVWMRFNQDDAKSLHLVVKQLSAKCDSVILYKPLKGPVEIGPTEINDLPNSESLFMLGIQTKRQAELLALHCDKIVLVDETHSTNHHGYKLVTVMIVDFNRRGWSVGHVISSNSDAESLQYFFKALKARQPESFKINCVISKDHPALINAMEKGFSEKLRHILCKWQLLKTFKEILRIKQDGPNDVVQPMMDELCMIVNAEDESTFHQLFTGFFNKYGDKSSGGSKFIAFLEKYYVKKVEKWAMCYRSFPHSNVNTTGHLESFHTRLKMWYLRRKVDTRLDDLVYMLQGIEYDDYMRRNKEEYLGFVSSPENILQGHLTGLEIPDSNVTNVDENTWEVKSRSICVTSYVVIQYHGICPLFDQCFFKCTEAPCIDLCEHMFSCSCADIHPLCKHVHKVQSFIHKCTALLALRTESDGQMRVDVNDKLQNDVEVPQCAASTPFDSSTENVTPENNLQTLKKNICLLQEFLETKASKNRNALYHAIATTDNLLEKLNCMDT